MQGQEHEEHRMTMKSQSEMEFEKGTEKTKYLKTYYERTRKLQEEWKKVCGVCVPLKKN
jgi:hypothetical protein